jgi:hypothetical protein
MLVLLIYKTKTTWPGLVIVFTGVPVYFLWRSFSETKDAKEQPAVEILSEEKSEPVSDEESSPKTEE